MKLTVTWGGGPISHEDCEGGYWCPRCELIWLALIATKQNICLNHPHSLLKEGT